MDRATYLASCRGVSTVAKYTICMDGTLTTLRSADSLVPPKNTGNRCTSNVTGLNMAGNVRFTSPDRIWDSWEYILQNKF